MEIKVQTNTGHKARLDQQLQKPALYNVIIHNDDYTTMDFVVEVLIRIFNKKHEDAAMIMTHVHENGRGVAGTYTYDIAATKKMETDKNSRETGFPLKLTLEELG